MNQEQRKYLEYLDNLVESQDKLMSLAECDGFNLLLSKLSEMRVESMYSAIKEGDTTDDKAWARAINTIVTYLYSLKDRTLLDDLVRQKKQFMEDVAMIEMSEKNDRELSRGLSSTI